MTPFNLFIYGLVVGVVVAAPIGPIGALCIQRSLNLGFKAGLLTGIGSALADGVFGLIIACGLTFISSQLNVYQTELQCLGGIILLYLGVMQFLQKPEHYRMKKHQQVSWRFVTGAFLLSISNSAAILLFLAVLAALGLSHLKLNFVDGSLFVLSIVLGSSLVWLLLSAGVAFILKKRINPYTLRLMNYVFGTTFLVLGILILGKVIASAVL